MLPMPARIRASRRKFLMGRDRPRACSGQPGRGHFPGERLGPHLGQGRGVHPGGKDQDLAEAPGILEKQVQPAFQLKHQVNVGQGRGGGRSRQQTAGHAQMDEQGDAAFQVETGGICPGGAGSRGAAPGPSGGALGGRTAAAGVCLPPGRPETGAPPARGPDPGG